MKYTAAFDCIGVPENIEVKLLLTFHLQLKQLLAISTGPLDKITQYRNNLSIVSAMLM